MQVRATHDPITRNIIILALTAFAEAVFLLIGVGLISSLVSIPQHPFAAKLYPYFQYDVHPEREALLYRIFIVAAMAVFAGLIYVFRNTVQGGTLSGVRRYLYFSAGLNVLLLAAVFKIILTGNPIWARGVLYGGLVIGILGRIFFPEVIRIAGRVRVRLKALSAARPAWASAWMMDAGMVVLLVLLLWPDMQAVLARIFVRDQFYHIDIMFAAAGWGMINGLTPNIDITAPYGVVIPWFFTHITRLMGGFDYPAIVALLITLGIGYYVVFYFLLTQFLQGRLLAAAGVFLAIKWQLFHWGVAPLVWSYPMATPLRSGLDLGMLLSILMYMRGKDIRWLWVGAACTGVTLVWMSDVGIYLMTAWIVFLALMAYLKSEPVMRIIPLAIFPGVIGVAVLMGITGTAIFKPLYWQHLAEHAALFINGWGALPMTEGLKERQFWAYVMGFVFPCVYVLTLTVAGAMTVRHRRMESAVFLIVACVYGLGLYHYFIFRSGVTSYCAVSIPLVAVLVYWAHIFLKRLPDARQRHGRMLAAGICLAALLGNYFFTRYPNVLNLSGYNARDEKAYYAAQFDMSVDAALVSALTAPTEPAAIISSFETKILMQAKRRPFFYYFPLMESALMDTDRLRHTLLYTGERLTQTLHQLKAQAPAYVFVERKLYSTAFTSGESGVAALITAVNKDYAPDKEGKFLIAFKRRVTP